MFADDNFYKASLVHRVSGRSLYAIPYSMWLFRNMYCSNCDARAADDVLRLIIY